MSQPHDRKPERKAGGPDDGGVDWFRALDIAIWVAVAAVAVMAAEWLIGKYIRESIATGAQRLLKKEAAAGTHSPE